MESQSLHINRH